MFRVFGQINKNNRHNNNKHKIIKVSYLYNDPNISLVLAPGQVSSAVLSALVFVFVVCIFLTFLNENIE